MAPIGWGPTRNCCNPFETFLPTLSRVSIGPPETEFIFLAYSCSHSSSEKFRLCRLHDGRNRWELLSFILITHRAYRIRYIKTHKTFSNYFFQAKRHPTMGSHVTHVGNIHGLLTSTMTTENWQLWKLCQQWQLRWRFYPEKDNNWEKIPSMKPKSAVQLYLTKCSLPSEVQAIYIRNLMNHLSMKSSLIYDVLCYPTAIYINLDSVHSIPRGISLSVFCNYV